jgi:hypothetical protein
MEEKCQPANVLSFKYSNLVYHKTDIKTTLINCTVEDYVNSLEKQIDGLTGGHDPYSYYTFNGRGMQILLNHLKQDAKLSTESMFLDVGSGRGHTVFCVANILKPAIAIGIEGDNNRFRV